MNSLRIGGRGGKPLVEDCLTLDLAWIMRLGPIEDGQAGSGEIHWRLDGAPFQTARFRLDLQNRESATLTISSETINQTMRLTTVSQNFGGRRWWMRCPVTGDRVRCLYLPPGGTRFASRKAFGLTYRVERLTRFDRPFEKLFRAQRGLSEVQGLCAGLKRPKGMWNRTYAYHVQQLAKLELDCVSKIAMLVGQPGGGPVDEPPHPGG